MERNVSFEGGIELEKILSNAFKNTVHSIDVGFFKKSTYTDGTPVAMVAIWNEFGTKKGGKDYIPERPFFRQANKTNQKNLINLIKKNIDIKTMAVDERLAELIGIQHSNAIKKSIIDWKIPPNAESTLKAKYPKSNPLVDTGLMAKSPTYMVNK
jgi:hypothetical protein